ncbi:hypothetical protein [Methylobacter tundripaludum]|uniref:NACHT domain-containing protein n=1 Tax=Methylobacter tundripaludum (strain ATCC BAA-1195 / DSM 17260 / SV96) TaxID=697282 RepID=G3J1H9_METTV|nr:hypothetical protein [Methylobacter tundripaludum]EGW21051.1 hypothetical protein Mettu_4206 [Methylobacter tundripaludum SV96]
MSDGKKLESAVKQYAGYIWNRPATSDRIAGVNFDCILEISPIEKIIIEITENKTLDKIRIDIGKIQTVRMKMLSENILIRPFIICDFTPTQGMKDAGKETYIEVISFDDFKKMFFDFATYKHIRSNKQFGSAVDPITGKSDESKYTPVGYELIKNGEISAEEIAHRIIKNEKVVLLGDYGTGKSRCFMEVFRILSSKAEETLIYPIAIDLKETWGLENAIEIITRHFRHLGIKQDGIDNVVKAFNGNRLCFLLDGFDEIGSRPWSEDKKTLELLRKHALQGVNDLLSTTNAGFLISGREHYFNSNNEMLSSLGLRENNVTIARCKNEFSYAEFIEYLSLNNIKAELPEWLPKKPLVLKTIASLNQTELEDIFISSNNNEIEFWFKFIDAMCERDSKIHAILDPEVVKQVLIKLSNITRYKPQNVGPITEAEIVNIFHEVTGTYPNEQSTVMLQRLPGLGRVSTETSDRNFIDGFILDGLRALDLSQSIQSNDKNISNFRWINPLQHLGTSVLAHDIYKQKNFNIYISYVKQSIHRNSENKIAISDIISAISKTNIEKVDYEGITLLEPHFGEISFEKNNFKNIYFVDGIFESITLGKIDPENITIKRCNIVKLKGVSSTTGRPDWIDGSNEINSYEPRSTLAAIKKTGLSNAQKILVSILIKVYKQHGNGRLERTLNKGLTQVDKKILKEVIHYLVKNNHLLTSKDSGEGEIIYKPVRKLQTRIEKILEELDRSSDEIWKSVSAFDEAN